MTPLDEILYNALQADADLTQAVGARITSTCFEVSPDDQDNTPLPCIIVTDDGLQNQPGTKDCGWEADEDHVAASVEIDARSPKEVKSLLDMVRRAVAGHIRQLCNDEEDVPMLDSVQTNGIAWDWTRPCYHTTITYNCTVTNNINN